jgi:hypothetical protein
MAAALDDHTRRKALRKNPFALVEYVTSAFKHGEVT